MATQAITAGSLIDNDAAVVRAGGSANTKFDSSIALGSDIPNFNLLGGAPTANRGFQSLAGGVPGEVTDYVKLIDVTVADQISDNYPGKNTDMYPGTATPTYSATPMSIYYDWTYAFPLQIESSPTSFAAIDLDTNSYGEDRSTQFTFSNGSKISPSGSH